MTTLLLVAAVVFLCALIVDLATMSVHDMIRRDDLALPTKIPWIAIIVGPMLVLVAVLVVYPFIIPEWPDSVRGIPTAAVIGVIAVGALATLAYVLVQREHVFKRRTQRRLNGRRSIPLKGFWVIAAILIYWKFVGDYYSPTAPSPPAWWTAAKAQYDDGSLGEAFWQTMGTFVVGFIAATIVGVVLGNAVGSSRRFARASGPTFEVARTTPAAPFVPILLLFLPSGLTFSVLIIVLAAMWPVLLSTASARESVPQMRLDVARTFNLGRWAVQQKIVLPSLIPGIAVGLRISGPLALIITLLIEILTTTGGLGTLMSEAQQNFEPAGAFSVIVLVGIIGYLVNVFVVRTESFLLRRWAASAY